MIQIEFQIPFYLFNWKMKTSASIEKRKCWMSEIIMSDTLCNCSWEPHLDLDSWRHVIDRGEDRRPVENMWIFRYIRDFWSLWHSVPHRIWISRWRIRPSFSLCPGWSCIQGIAHIRQEPPTKKKLPRLDIAYIIMAHVFLRCFLCFPCWDMFQTRAKG